MNEDTVPVRILQEDLFAGVPHAPVREVVRSQAPLGGGGREEDEEAGKIVRETEKCSWCQGHLDESQHPYYLRYCIHCGNMYGRMVAYRTKERNKLNTERKYYEGSQRHF